MAVQLRPVTPSPEYLSWQRSRLVSGSSSVRFRPSALGAAALHCGRGVQRLARQASTLSVPVRIRPSVPIAPLDTSSQRNCHRPSEGWLPGSTPGGGNRFARRLRPRRCSAVGQRADLVCRRSSVRSRPVARWRGQPKAGGGARLLRELPSRACGFDPRPLRHTTSATVPPSPLRERRISDLPLYRSGRSRRLGSAM